MQRRRMKVFQKQKKIETTTSGKIGEPRESQKKPENTAKKKKKSASREGDRSAGEWPPRRLTKNENKNQQPPTNQVRRTMGLVVQKRVAEKSSSSPNRSPRRSKKSLLNCGRKRCGTTETGAPEVKHREKGTVRGR